MRKLNYQEPKIIELLQGLSELGFEYLKAKESIEVQLIDVKSDKKRIVHLLCVVNGVYKAIPLVQQLIEGDTVLSIYDQRV